VGIPKLQTTTVDEIMWNVLVWGGYYWADIASVNNRYCLQSQSMDVKLHRIVEIIMEGWYSSALLKWWVNNDMQQSTHVFGKNNFLEVWMESSLFEWQVHKPGCPSLGSICYLQIFTTPVKTSLKSSTPTSWVRQHNNNLSSLGLLLPTNVPITPTIELLDGRVDKEDGPVWVSIVACDVRE
jgi:hypothetical protein